MLKDKKTGLDCKTLEDLEKDGLIPISLNDFLGRELIITGIEFMETENGIKSSLAIILEGEEKGINVFTFSQVLVDILRIVKEREYLPFKTKVIQEGRYYKFC